VPLYVNLHVPSVQKVAAEIRAKERVVSRRSQIRHGNISVLRVSAMLSLIVIQSRELPFVNELRNKEYTLSELI
jgi:hypothetical protein